MREKMKNTRGCPICRTTTTTSLYANARIDPKGLGNFAYSSRKLPEYMHLQLMICRSCDLIYASPIPDERVLKSAYVSAAYDSGVEAKFAALGYANLIRSIIPQLPDFSAALDIGAGDGAFCAELLKTGFKDVVGVEPSSAPVAAASEEIRSHLLQELFLPNRFDAERFSLVTCFQTIEHVPDPLGCCQEAHRLLKPGGAMCLVGHNFRAFSARVLGRRSPIYDVEHLQLFSPNSFSQMLKMAGFRNICVKTVRNRYPLSYWTRLFPFPSSVKSGLLSVLRASKLGEILVTLPAGNLIAYGFR